MKKRNGIEQCTVCDGQRNTFWHGDGYKQNDVQSTQHIGMARWTTVEKWYNKPDWSKRARHDTKIMPCSHVRR